MSALYGTYARSDLAFERGEGAWLWTVDGRRFLDFGSGIATTRPFGSAVAGRRVFFQFRGHGRSDAPPGAVLTERVGGGQQTAALTLKWTFTGVGTTTGIATVNIIEPAPMQAGTRVRYRCPGG